MEEKVVTESIKQVDSSYGIVLKIPTGVVTPDMLRKIADVYEKYNCKVIKLTCAQRIAIIGIEEKDIEAVWRDLGVEPAAAQDCVSGVLRSVLERHSANSDFRKQWIWDWSLRKDIMG